VRRRVAVDTSPTQLNSTRRQVELSCVAINGPLVSAAIVTVTLSLRQIDSWDVSEQCDCQQLSQRLFLASRIKTRNLAIANRSRVACAHKVTTVSKSPKMIFEGHSRSSDVLRLDRMNVNSYYRYIVTMTLS